MLNRLFRRKLAAVAFFGGIGILAYQLYTQEKRLHATVVLDLGASAQTAQSVAAELIVEGEARSSFRRDRLPGTTVCPCKFDIAVPESEAELRIEVNLGTATRTLTRIIHVDEGATVTVHLGPLLATP